MAHGLSCSAACGIFPDQGSNPCSLHWQADSQPLRHQGSPWVVPLNRRPPGGLGGTWGGLLPTGTSGSRPQMRPPQTRPRPSDQAQLPNRPDQPSSGMAPPPIDVTLSELPPRPAGPGWMCSALRGSLAARAGGGPFASGRGGLGAGQRDPGGLPPRAACGAEARWTPLRHEPPALQPARQRAALRRLQPGPR